MRTMRTGVFPLLLVSLGFTLLIAGFTSIRAIYQLLNSSLDEALSAEGDYPSIDLDLASSAGEDGESFIPIYASRDTDNADSAPAVEISVEEYQDPDGSDDRIAVPSLVPERLVIESLGVDSQVVPVDYREVEYLGEVYQQWRAPRDHQLGWHSTSARAGDPGNTVINGHSSGYGESFKDLDLLENGDLIHVYAENYRYTYQVANTMIMKERWEDIDVRMNNASWINPSDDERLTLVSCWPNNSSTHRLIVVAVPVSETLVELAFSDGGQAR